VLKLTEKNWETVKCCRQSNQGTEMRYRERTNGTGTTLDHTVGCGSALIPPISFTFLTSKKHISVDS